MKKFESKLFSIIAFFLSTTAAAFGANKIDGYSVIFGKADRRQHHKYSLQGNMSTVRARNTGRGRRIYQNHQPHPAM
jgi:hypothetical protein